MNSDPARFSTLNQTLTNFIVNDDLDSIQNTLDPLYLQDASFLTSMIQEFLFQAIEYNRFEIASYLFQKNKNFLNKINSSKINSSKINQNSHLEHPDNGQLFYALITHQRDIKWFELLYQPPIQKNKKIIALNQSLIELALSYNHLEALNFLLKHHFHDPKASCLFKEKLFYGNTNQIESILCLMRVLEEPAILSEFKKMSSFQVWRSIISDIKNLNQGQIQISTELNQLLHFIATHHPINTQNDLGITPLMLCASREKVELFQWFLEQGANINTQDLEGDTCIHWLNYGIIYDPLKRQNILDLLFEKNMDFSILNHQQKTLSDLLNEQPHAQQNQIGELKNYVDIYMLKQQLSQELKPAKIHSESKKSRI